MVAMSTEADIQSLISLGIKKAGGNSTKLAEALGVSRTAVEKWMSGTEMRAGNFFGLLRYVGGDPDRALPDYQPPVRAEVPVEGKVTATSGVFSSDNERRVVPGGLIGLLKDSRLDSITHGAPVYIQVNGNSMAPDYPDGSMLVCKRPTSLREMPHNAPVIARVDGDLTFKYYQRSGNFVHLFPINSTEHTVQTFEARKVEIDYVVVARFVINEFGKPRKESEIGKVTMLRRDRKKKTTGSVAIE